MVTEGRIIMSRDRPTREKEKQGMMPPQMQRGALSVDSGGEYLVGHGNNFLGSQGNLIMIIIYLSAICAIVDNILCNCR